METLGIFAKIYTINYNKLEYTQEYCGKYGIADKEFIKYAENIVNQKNKIIHDLSEANIRIKNGKYYIIDCEILNSTENFIRIFYFPN